MQKLNWMFSGTAHDSHQVCQFFFVSSVCLLVRVTTVDKNKAVVCCLLLRPLCYPKRKRKMWSKKWYLKRMCLEMMPSWLSAGKLRKLWDSLSELRSSLCERRLERTVLRPPLLPVKTAQFTQFFRQVWRHIVKLLILTGSVMGT